MPLLIMSIDEVATDVKQMPIRPVIIIIIKRRKTFGSCEFRGGGGGAILQRRW